MFVTLCNGTSAILGRFYLYHMVRSEVAEVHCKPTVVGIVAPL